MGENQKRSYLGVICLMDHICLTDEETKMFCKCQIVCLGNFKTDFPDVYKMVVLVIKKN